MRSFSHCLTLPYLKKPKAFLMASDINVQAFQSFHERGCRQSLPIRLRRDSLRWKFLWVKIMSMYALCSLVCRVLFISPLHRAWFAYEHYKYDYARGSTPCGSISQFIVMMIVRFDPVVLKYAESRTVDGKILERIYTMEAYRAETTLMPKTTVLSVDVGRVSDLLVSSYWI